MSINYTISNSAEFRGATVIFSDGSVRPVAHDHPKFDEIAASLIAGTATEEELLAMVSPFESVYKELTFLTDRVARKGNKLLLDGSVINTGLAQKIISLMDTNGDAQPYLNFLESLATNPSVESQRHLYDYVQRHGLSILETGEILFYKGVTPDVRGQEPYARWRSMHSGMGVVQTPDGGVFEYDDDYLPNDVGYIVSIPRDEVNTDRGVACSTGLHAGTFAYASDFAGGGALLSVAVWPRDVVSVPSDSDGQKVRTTRYRVIGVNTSSKPAAEGVVKTTKSKNRPKDGSRVEEYKALIPGLVKSGVSLRKFRSKNVTSGRRGEFTEAARQLGYDLS